jgi:hypothetical protein
VDANTWLHNGYASDLHFVFKHLVTNREKTEKDASKKKRADRLEDVKEARLERNGEEAVRRDHERTYMV